MENRDQVVIIDDSDEMYGFIGDVKKILDDELAVYFEDPDATVKYRRYQVSKIN